MPQSTYSRPFLARQNLRASGATLHPLSFSLCLCLSIFITTLAAASDSWWGGFSLPPTGGGISGSTPSHVSDMIGFETDLVVAGEFDDAGGSSFANIASWDGMEWSALGDGLDDASLALCTDDGKLIAGGLFSSSGPVPLSRIASWDGEEWSPLGDGFDGPVDALAIYNGQLLAGGRFAASGTTNTSSLAVWDGAVWASFGDFDGDVLSIEVLSGQLYVGGTFLQIDSNAAAGIGVYDGVSWQEVGGGVNGSVNSLSIFEGDLVAGGAFSQAGSTSADNIAIWDGSSWASLGSGLDDAVGAIAPFRHGLAVTGEFSAAGSSAASRVAAWDGVSWSPMGGGLDAGGLCLRQHDGALFVGGSFASAGGQSSGKIARWDVEDPSVLRYDISVDRTGHFPTLQYAADAGAKEDELRLAAGVYMEDLQIRAKWLDIEGVDGRDMTEVRSVHWQAECGEGCSDVPISALARLSGLSVRGTTEFFADNETSGRIEDCRLFDFLTSGSGVSSSFSVRTTDLLAGGNVSSGPFSGASISGSYCTGLLRVEGESASASGNVFFDHADVSVGGTESYLLENEFRSGSSGGLGGFASTATGNLFVDAGLLTVNGQNVIAEDNELVRSQGIHVAQYGWTTDVMNNRLMDCAEGIRILSHDVVTLSGNVLVRCGAGLVNGNEDPYFTAASTIANNTVVECGGAGISWEQDNDNAEIILTNNIVSKCDEGVRVDEFDVLTTSCNDIWNSVGADWIGLSNPTGVDGNVSANPLFCNPTFLNFGLSSDSPCAPSANPDCGLIGATPVDCGSVSSSPEPEVVPITSTRVVLEFPNPIRPNAEVRLRGTFDSAVQVSLFDLSGRRVLGPKVLSGVAGSRSFRWSGLGASGLRLSAGVYVWRIEAGLETVSQKVIVAP